MTTDLFGPESEPGKAPGTGLLATNHLNLLYILAAGLVMPPAGFGEKYYRDTLESVPGWIPLFIDKAPAAAIELSQREAGHLKPVLVEIDLGRLSGPVMAIREDGAVERQFPEQCSGMERVVLVPAPLPVSWIASIIFQSANDRKAVDADAKDFGNVPLRDFKLRTNKTLFTKAPIAAWPSHAEPARRPVSLEAPLAAGGVMAMLQLFGNLGAQAQRASQCAFDPDGDAPRPVDDHSILAGLGTWIRKGAVRFPDHPGPAHPITDRDLHVTFQAKLFWETVERLVQWREAGRVGTADNVPIDHLAATEPHVHPRLQAGVGKLRDTLVSLSGLADATTSEIFERHDTPLARALTLFLLRPACADLVDFRSEQLREPDWLAAAILFGVRDGWLGLPLRLRACPGLPAAVSHRMAQMAHRLDGSGLDLGEPPPRVRPLRELFGDGSTWRAGDRSAALELARMQKWDCIRTLVNLGPGEYRLTVKGGSTQVEIPGEPRIFPEIDRDRFFHALAGVRLDPTAEAKLRTKLRG